MCDPMETLDQTTLMHWLQHFLMRSVELAADHLPEGAVIVERGRTILEVLHKDETIKVQVRFAQLEGDMWPRVQVELSSSTGRAALEHVHPDTNTGGHAKVILDFISAAG